MARVVLYTRPGCHLCDVARQVVAVATGQAGAGYDEVDVRTSPELLAEHGARVPVVTVDDREVGHFRVSVQQVQAALAGPPPDAGAPGRRQR